MPRVIVSFSIPLAGLFTVVILLSVTASRTLPGMGTIAFFWFRDGAADIYVVDIARGTLHNLTHSGTPSGSFAFSPDGSQLTFQSLEAQEGRQIYVMNTECENLLVLCREDRRLLTNGDNGSYYPAWSPDGTQIAYVYDEPSDSREIDHISVIDLASASEHSLPYETFSIMPVLWSPDGRRMLYTTDRSGYLMYSMNPDGSDLRVLASEFWYAGPVWSPDGTHIMYAVSEGAIYLMDADGRRRRAIVDEGFTGVDLEWSPDGSSVAFIATRNSILFINVLDLNSGDVYPVNAGSVQYNGLAWSPDSRQLAYVGFDGAAFNIFVIDRDGQSRRRLTHSGGVDAPRWWP